ncbi:hypothetical protein [Nonomuraea sp. 10N515B]|uniref:hypothetical protein n=1 Tax=Nonomuraea sp. 10N515B TaxID=3457422 RepID=UPI003FCD0D0B
MDRDPLRLVADAHLREFDAIRREIELRLQHRERMMTYFFVLTGALLASQVIFEKFASIQQIFVRDPIVLLAIGFALLWFPVETVMSFSYMRHMGRYVKDILAPKLTAISESIDSQTAHGRRYKNWQDAAIAPDIRGQLRWEAYLKISKPYAYPYFGFSLFALIRLLILFGPSLFTIYLYAAVRLAGPRPAWWLLIVELGIILAMSFTLVTAIVRTAGSR